MKQVRKIVAFAVALFMAFAIALPALADEGGKITITLPTEPAPTSAVTYNIYKVFNATSNGSSSAIAYTLLDGETKANFEADASGIANYFEVDSVGNVTAKSDSLSTEAINAIATYAKAKNQKQSVTSEVGATTVEANVGYGYFYIDTTTGTAVTITSTNPNVTVDDKNSLTTVDKTLENGDHKAIQETGGTETFKGYITLGKGAKNVKYHDTMTNMTYNGDVVVTIGNATIAAEGNYTVTAKANNAGFDVVFDDSFIAGYEENTVITLTYSGTITTDAWDEPAINQATVTSGGNEDGNEQTSTPDEDVYVYTAQVGVNKTFVDGNGNESAGFVLKKKATVNGAETDVYYKLDGDKVTWVSSIDDADEHTTANGVVAPFVGLDNGTYYLEEKTVPAGFNKATDTEVVIADGNYEASNLNQTGNNGKNVENRKGSVMPSTGGIGTTIFYVVGGVLVVGAVVFLLTKRRAASNAE